MTTLKELIESVQEKNLSKDQLEKYRDEMSHVFALMQIELADIEKEKALFFNNKKEQMPESTDIAIKRLWQCCSYGLREIELKRYTLATKEILSSLRNRLYNFY